MAQSTTIEHKQLLIDGEWRDAGDGAVREIVNPATIYTRNKMTIDF